MTRKINSISTAMAATWPAASPGFFTRSNRSDGTSSITRSPSHATAAAFEARSTVATPSPTSITWRIGARGTAVRLIALPSRRLADHLVRGHGDRIHDRVHADAQVTGEILGVGASGGGAPAGPG